MRLKWKLALATHTLAMAWEIFLVVLLFKNITNQRIGSYAWLYGVMIVVFSLTILRNLFVIFCITRYHKAELSFATSVNRLYTGFIVFIILFTAILVYIAFDAISTAFDNTGGISHPDTVGLGAIISFCLICLWNLIAQVQFRKYVKKKQRANLNELINNIGQPAS